jgi:hypothetical protein
MLGAICILASVTTIVAQKKYEREYRLKESEVPTHAREFIHSIAIEKKIRWFYEENLLGNSIEAKFKYDDQKYSVEFDTLGNFQDIEIEIELSEVPKAVARTIVEQIDGNYSKNKIRKIQVQFSGEISSLGVFVSVENPGGAFEVKYELVVKGKKERDWNLYEMTFNRQGHLEATSEILLRNIDNLVY